MLSMLWSDQAIFERGRKEPSGMENGNVVEVFATNLFKALRDPGRAWILGQINDAPAAAVDLEKRCDMPRNLISYHLGMLVKYECAEQVDEVRVRGTYKKIFRGTVPAFMPPTDWENMSQEARNGWSIRIVTEAWDRIQTALEAGTFDKRLDRVAGNYKPRLDEEGWKEAFAIVAEVHRLFAPDGPLEEASLARTPDHAQRRPFTLSMFLYESPPGS
jgi:hypothetical protein